MNDQYCTKSCAVLIHDDYVFIGTDIITRPDADTIRIESPDSFGGDAIECSVEDSKTVCTNVSPEKINSQNKKTTIKSTTARKKSYNQLFRIALSETVKKFSQPSFQDKRNIKSTNPSEIKTNRIKNKK